MVTMICRLTLPGGQVITGTIQNASCDIDDYPVEYNGPSSLLPEKPEVITANLFEFYFKEWAEQLNAKELSINNCHTFGKII